MRLSFRSSPVSRPIASGACAAALCLFVNVATASAQTPPTAPQPPPPAAPPPGAPAAPPAAGAADKTGPPRLPPFAGTVVSFDRRGERVVACVDRSTVPMRPRAGAPQPPPSSIKLPPAYRIWLIEREVMQELMTTGGLCHPIWSPDGKTFLAAGARGLFTFTEPQYEARVLTAILTPPQNAAVTTGQPNAPATPPTAVGDKAPEKPGASASPPPGTAIVKTTDGAPIPFSQTSWSPAGGRIAFLFTTPTGAKVRVVDAKTGNDVFTRDKAAKLVQWGPDDRTLVIDGTRVPIP